MKYIEIDNKQVGITVQYNKQRKKVSVIFYNIQNTGVGNLIAITSSNAHYMDMETMNRLNNKRLLAIETEVMEQIENKNGFYWEELTKFVKEKV